MGARVIYRLVNGRGRYLCSVAMVGALVGFSWSDVWSDSLSFSSRKRAAAVAALLSACGEPVLIRTVVL